LPFLPLPGWERAGVRVSEGGTMKREANIDIDAVSEKKVYNILNF
jgi:hypothetical protein